MRYVYSLVRFVPDPARGEFVNVGAVVGSDESSEWQVRQIENPVRARAIDEQRSLSAVWSFMDRIGVEVDRFESSLNQLLRAPEVELNEEWLWRLHADHQNIVQLSAPTPLAAESADDALDRVFSLMVLDPAVRQQSFTKKHAALAAMRRAFRDAGVLKGDHLSERVQLSTAHHTERFDFAVANGRVLQLAQTWSFQVPDQDTLAERVKAWAWTVQDARQAGGTVGTADGLQLEVRPDVDVRVVYVAAPNDRQSSAFADARHIFDELDVAAVAYDRAGDVALRARELLGPSTPAVLT